MPGGVCRIVPGGSTPVLAKHSKSFSLIDCIAVGVDRMQWNFEPMQKQVETWQRSELTDVTAKVVIDEAFVEGKLEAPKHLARMVHDLYFEPKYEEFRSRTIWCLSNAFSSAFKELEPIPQIQGDRQAGRVPGILFLAIVLTLRGGVGQSTLLETEKRSRCASSLCPVCESGLWEFPS